MKKLIIIFFIIWFSWISSYFFINFDHSYKKEVTIDGSNEYKLDDIKAYFLGFKLNVKTDIVETSYGYKYIYSARNFLGIKRKVEINVNIVDKDAPIITLKGDNPLTITTGTAYIEKGYSAFDKIDGELSNKVTVSSNININKVGTYEVVYNYNSNPNLSIIVNKPKIAFDWSAITNSTDTDAFIYGIVENTDGNILITHDSSSCFVMNEANKQITDYVCYSGNPFGFSSNTSVTVPSTLSGVSITSVGGSAFKSKGLKSVVISSGITTLNSQSFLGNSISSLNLGSVTTIGSYAFRDNALTSVIIPNSVTTINSYAFFGNNLSTASIGTGVTTIGSYAFYKASGNNANLTKIINKTTRSFDCKSITGGSSTATFVTGTIKHSSGNITVSSS